MHETADVHGLVRDDAVHSSLYSDPRVFELEMERIFHRAWVFLAHEGEIPSPGDFRTAWMGRTPVIVTRSDDGQVHAVVNRCRHRGASVCIEDRGCARQFRCSYHGWTYDLGGNLVSVPLPSGYSGLNKEELGLIPVTRVESYRGFVFGSSASTGPTLAEYLGGTTALLDEFVDRSPTGSISFFRGVQRTGYDGNWKYSLENGVDGYHPSFVHRTALPDSVMRAYRHDGTGHTTKAISGHGLLDSRVDGTIRRDGGVGGGFFLALFPNLVLLRGQLRVVRPIAVDRTEVRTYAARLDGVGAEVNEQRLREHEECFGPAGTIWPDDAEIFRRNQEALTGEIGTWHPITRGVHREHVTDDGVVVGEMTDEVPQRAFWRTWRTWMGPVAPAAVTLSRG